MTTKPTVLVTGACGTLGARLIRHLASFQVIGTDLREPESLANLFRFERIDLAEERSCDQLLDLLRAYGPEAVVHLAVVDSLPQLRKLDPPSLWAVNVAGTSRVLEAIAEYNRLIGGIEQFVFLSTAAVYGPKPDLPVPEDAGLNARGLVYALQQQEADLTVRARAASLRHCNVHILRPQNQAGAGIQNYPLAVLRGYPGGQGLLAEHLRRRATRLPLLLPANGDYLEHKFQFVHVDDIARLIGYIVQPRKGDPRLQILNVAGRGEPLSLRRCAEIAHLPVKHLPSAGLCRQALGFLWDWDVSEVPPEFYSYLLGSCVLDTTRLRVFLGNQYRSTIQYTSEEALLESMAFFATARSTANPTSPAKSP
jgi:nucleoside-diphosphate-sugar epimerase